MNTIEREVRNHPFLIGLKPSHLTVICGTAHEASFKPGQVILREREPAFNAYLLTSGRVSIEVHSRISQHDVSVDTIQAGDVLGWSWLFAPFCWHFQAKAIETTRAIALDGSALLVRCEEDHELGHALMKRMTQLLIRRLEAARRTIIRLDAGPAQGALPPQPSAAAENTRNPSA